MYLETAMKMEIMHSLGTTLLWFNCLVC